ncbi:MAG: cell wall protein [Myxococcales bacterium]|nr:cell wall protein [Myxococcales bacterium]
MSVERAFREMIRDEVEIQLRPMRETVAKLQDGTAGLNGLRELAERLAPLGSLLNGGSRRSSTPPAPVARRRRGPVRGKNRGDNARPCALEDCKRNARSKGYCAAHYQKFRNLARSNRLPSDWVEFAAPRSVKNISLPRGRAAAKALAQGKA